MKRKELEQLAQSNGNPQPGQWRYDKLQSALPEVENYSDQQVSDLLSELGWSQRSEQNSAAESDAANNDNDLPPKHKRQR